MCASSGLSCCGGKTSVAEIDRDCRAVLDYLAQHPLVSATKLGAAGFCIGGHLSFRAALYPDVRATVCFYGTGIHDGRLGRDADAGSLQRAGDIKGELLMIFGESDPHIPKEGRERIRQACDGSRSGPLPRPDGSRLRRSRGGRASSTSVFRASPDRPAAPARRA